MATKVIRTALAGTALALVAMGTVAVSATDAEAKPRRKRAPATQLVPPTSGIDQDAAGTLRITTNQRRGSRVMVVRVRNLEPRTIYEIRDAATDRVLGTVKTNRRGVARVRLRDRQFGEPGAPAVGKRGGGVDLDGVDGIAVVDMEEDAPVLMDEGAEDDAVEPEEEAEEEEPGLPAFGDAFVGEEDGVNALIFMDSFPEEDFESFSLSLCLPEHANEGESNGAVEFFDFFANNQDEDGLPLGVDSVRDLEGRKFDILDGDGETVLEGNLPEMEEIDLSDLWKPFPGDGDGGWFGIAEGEWGFDDWNVSDWDWSYGDDRDDDDSDDPAKDDDESDEDRDDNEDDDAGDDDSEEWPDWREGLEESEFVLRIADENGDLQDVGNLYLWSFDWDDSIDWDGDWGEWDGEWDEDWDDWFDCPEGEHDDWDDWDEGDWEFDAPWEDWFGDDEKTDWGDWDFDNWILPVFGG